MSKGALLVGLGLLLLWLSITGRLRAALVAIGAAKGDANTAGPSTSTADQNGVIPVSNNMSNVFPFVPPGAIANVGLNQNQSAYGVPAGDNGTLTYV